jgi:hypothetical protein
MSSAGGRTRYDIASSSEMGPDGRATPAYIPPGIPPGSAGWAGGPRCAKLAQPCRHARVAVDVADVLTNYQECLDWVHVTDVRHERDGREGPPCRCGQGP